MIHWLKTDIKYFEMTWAGDKTFEIRNNDRNFKEDDILILAEGHLSAQTHRCVIARVRSVVSYVLDDHVVLGLVILGHIDQFDEDRLQLFKYRKETITCEEWTSRSEIKVGNEKN